MKKIFLLIALMLVLIMTLIVFIPLFLIFNLLYIFACLWEFKILNYKKLLVSSFTEKVYDKKKKKIVKIYYIDEICKEFKKIFKKLF